MALEGTKGTGKAMVLRAVDTADMVASSLQQLLLLKHLLQVHLELLVRQITTRNMPNIMALVAKIPMLLMAGIRTTWPAINTIHSRRHSNPPRRGPLLQAPRAMILRRHHPLAAPRLPPMVATTR